MNIDMPTDRANFLLFGMGPKRRKLLYIPGGRLVDALTLEPVRTWEAASEVMDATEYRVDIRLESGRTVAVVEDETGVWIEQYDDRIAITEGAGVLLPRFHGHPFAGRLRALHSELLVNLMPFGPVPNLWVYPRPWYRDAAMVLMCLRATGNLRLVEPWIMGLHSAWDRNNAGCAEADNLGQVLFMVSLVDAPGHPVVGEVLKALPAYHRDGHIVGQTDGAEHPVYQTKWLKFGLRALGLDDPYVIPPLQDSYSSVFWMDYRDEHSGGGRFSVESLQNYPYLNWAEAHFHCDDPPEQMDEMRPPLTREAAASQAEYWRLQSLADCGAIPEKHLRNGVCMPHTWHAAEMFLYLLDIEEQDEDHADTSGRV